MGICSNYFLMQFRYLLRSPVILVVGVLSLGIGLSVGFLVVAFLQYHLTYDTQYTDWSDIFQIRALWRTGDGDFKESSYLSDFSLSILKEKSFENKSTVVERFDRPGSGVLLKGRIIDEKVTYVSSEFFEVFDRAVVSGDLDRWGDPASAVVSESCEKKYFHDKTAIGETFILDDKAFLIVAVVEDYPRLSHFRGGGGIFLVSEARKYWQDQEVSWLATVYFKKTGGSGGDLNEILQRLYRDRESELNRYSNFGFSAIPIRSVHLRAPGGGGFALSSVESWSFIVLLTFLGLSVLFVSCVNFLIIFLSQYVERFREIGVRKVLGAGRKEIFVQFLCEVFLVNIVSAVIAFSFAGLLTPWLNIFTYESVANIEYWSWDFLLALMLLFVVSLIVSGVYPAVRLSKASPLGVVRREKFRGRVLVVLVIFQFTITAALLVYCIGIYVQIKEVSKLDFGLSVEGNVSVGVVGGGGESERGVSSLYRLLSQHVNVSSVTGGVESGVSLGSYVAGWDNRLWEEPIRMTVFHDFLEHFESKILAGRGLLLGDAVGVFDKEVNIVLTKRGLRTLGFSDPNKVVGRALRSVRTDQVITIVGVADVFPIINNDYPLPCEADYLVATNRLSGLIVKYDESGFEGVREFIEKNWRGMGFDSSSLSFTEGVPLLNRAFHKLESPLQLVSPFAWLATVVSMLGLIATSQLMVKRKLRGMGIRKCCGASRGRIMCEVLFTCLRPMIVGLLLGTLLGYWFLRQSLQYFEGATFVGIFMVFVVPLVVFVAACFFVGIPAYRASGIAPVVALRAE